MAQTDRIIRAIDNPLVSIIGHPTGRLIGQRRPFALDMDRLMQAARDRGCMLELNANPVRLDLKDLHCRMAVEHGMKVAISTDVHSTGGLDNIRYGIDQARRGWLCASDVVNTQPWRDLAKLIRRS